MLTNEISPAEIREALAAAVEELLCSVPDGIITSVGQAVDHVLGTDRDVLFNLALDVRAAKLEGAWN